MDGSVRPRSFNLTCLPHPSPSLSSPPRDILPTLSLSVIHIMVTQSRSRSDSPSPGRSLVSHLVQHGGILLTLAKAVAGISPFGSFSLALRCPSLPFYFSSLAQYIPSTVGGHHIPLACLRSPRAYIAPDTCHLQLTTLRPIPWNLSAMENLAASSLDQQGMGPSPYHPRR